MMSDTYETADDGVLRDLRAIARGGRRASSTPSTPKPMTAQALRLKAEIARHDAMITAISRRCVLSREALRAWAAPRKPKEGRKWAWGEAREYERRLSNILADERTLIGLVTEMRSATNAYYLERGKEMPEETKRLLLLGELLTTQMARTANKRKGK
jgi:hypothetical protein